MNNKLLALILVPLLLTACANTDAATVNTTEPANASSEQVSLNADTTNILFYGDYVMDEGTPTTTYYYDRIIFYPDGKCYVHAVRTDKEAEEYDRGYDTYEYSYTSESDKVAIGSISGAKANILEIPRMSENRTLLKFDDYVLKLVDEE